MLEFVSGRISYITLKCQCDIVLDVHVPTEDKDDIRTAFTKN
jgi:hypothetical protein